MMSFFDPPMTTDSGRPYKAVRYDEILEEQVAISYISKGGISLMDTDGVSQYDRKIILQSLLKIKEQENENIKKVADSNKNIRRSTSRF